MCPSVPIFFSSYFFFLKKKKKERGTTLVAQWLRLLLPVWRGADSIPGQGAKTSHASGPKHSNQGKTKNRSNMVTNSIKTFKMVHIKKKKNLKKIHLSLTSQTSSYLSMCNENTLWPVLSVYLYFVYKVQWRKQWVISLARVFSAQYFTCCCEIPLSKHYEWGLL